MHTIHDAPARDLTTFSPEEVSRLVGVTVHQLRCWDRTGLVKPSLSWLTPDSDAYSFADLVTLRAVRQMLDAGITLRKIRKIIVSLQRLRPDLEQPLAELALITDGESVFLPTSDPDIMLSLLSQGQLVWKLPLGKIAGQIAEELSADIRQHPLYNESASPVQEVA